MHFLIPKTILKKRECNDFYDFWIFGTDAKHKKTEIGTEPEAPNLFGYLIRLGYALKAAEREYNRYTALIHYRTE